MTQTENKILAIEQRVISNMFMREFVRGSRQRLAIRQHQLEIRRRVAFGAGHIDGRMAGRSAVEAAKVLYHDDGEAAVCYMNGVADALAGLQY